MVPYQITNSDTVAHVQGKLNGGEDVEVPAGVTFDIYSSTDTLDIPAGRTMTIADGGYFQVSLGTLVIAVGGRITNNASWNYYDVGDPDNSGFGNTGIINNNGYFCDPAGGFRDYGTVTGNAVGSGC